MNKARVMTAAVSGRSFRDTTAVRDATVAHVAGRRQFGAAVMFYLN